ncbi:MAG: DUF1572 family protein [Bacteroidetes bacterium]|nr:DUF1572 family protein [Bacteroidota bacterium]
MNSTGQLSKHLYEVYFGGNWTWVNLRDTLSEVTVEEATTKQEHFNTIVALVYHIHYFVMAITKVLNNEELDSNDKFSFNHPTINTREEWEHFLQSVYAGARQLCKKIEAIEEARLGEIFVKEKYGTYYRNILGLIEHIHYHLGQIVIIKKLLKTKN